MKGDGAVKIVVHNEKGGCAKTETAMRLGAGFAARGMRTLLLDGDPQADLTRRLGQRPDDAGMKALMTGRPSCRVVLSEKLELVPASLDLETVNDELGKRKFGQLSVLDGMDWSEFDVVIFDTQTPYEYLTLNAYVAADHLVIPTQPVLDDLLGVMRVFETLNALQKSGIDVARPLGIVATRMRTGVRRYEQGLCLLNGGDAEGEEMTALASLRDSQGWPPLAGTVLQADGRFTGEGIRNAAYASIVDGLVGWLKLISKAQGGLLR